MSNLDDSCKTRYPILLVHGLGIRDTRSLRRHGRYWGRIPQVLAEHGASIFFANQDGMGIFETNALQILDTIEQILLFQAATRLMSSRIPRVASILEFYYPSFIQRNS